MGETSPAVRELTAAILVVDDEPAIVRTLASLLRRRGHEVDTAVHGRLALKKLQTRAYDLLLRDLRRPECEGPALYHGPRAPSSAALSVDHLPSPRRYIMLCLALPCGQRSRQAHGNRLRHDLEAGRVTA